MTLCAFGCAHTPIGPSETVVIAIAPQPDVILVGTSVQLNATNALTGSGVPASWSSSDPAVATISSGQMVGVGPGIVTISAIYRTSTATLTVKIVPNYAGTYQGTVFVIECVNASPGFCESNLRPGPETFTARWTQAKDSVSGLLFMRFGQGQIQGQIDMTGRLTVSGSIASVPSGGVLTTFESWSTQLNGSGTTMSGTFSMRLTTDTGRPLGVAQAEMRGIDRVP